MESAANGVQRHRIIMNPCHLFFLMAIAIIICPSEATAESQSIEDLASYDLSRVVNESNTILGSIVLSREQSEELFLIGEVAISSVLKKLEDLSRNNESTSGVELVETRNLAILYSDMSHSLGIERIPIMLARLEPKNKAISIGNITEERAMINATTIREDLFQPSQPEFTIAEISEGKRQSSSGGYVIWV